MKTTFICKADPLTKAEAVEGQVIYINDKIPRKMLLLETCQSFYEKQASLINKVLADTLPQGTYDRLGIKFMQKKVSLYRGRIAL